MDVLVPWLHPVQTTMKNQWGSYNHHCLPKDCHPNWLLAILLMGARKPRLQSCRMESVSTGEPCVENRRAQPNWLLSPTARCECTEGKGR